jgi:phosphinothricin acetyltransferase
MNTTLATPTIRPAVLSDLPAIHAIYSYSVFHDTASWELTPPDEAEMTRRMSVILGGGYPYLVAELAGRLVGYSYASSYRPRPGYRFTVENSVYVAADMQRRGLGRLLLSNLVAACTAKGYRQMIAVIGDSQNIASIELHRSLGFEQQGFLPNIGYKFGRWLDSVLMQRSLGDGATTMPADKMNAL